MSDLEKTARPGSSSRGRPGLVLVALGVLALAAVSVYAITQIPMPPLARAVGPRAFPILVTIGLALCGIGLLRAGVRDRLDLEAIGIDWTARRGNLAWFATGLVLNVILIEPIGFVVASTVMFVCIARAFSRGHLLRDAVTGFTFALTVYLGFRLLLGVTIGPGLLGDLL